MLYRRLTLRTALTIALVPGAMLAADLPGSLSRDTFDVLHSVLEQRFERAEIGDPNTIVGVIALGGSEDRLREAARLARLYPHLKVFVSGGGEHPYLASLVGEDIAKDRLIYENQSMTTYQNAVFSKLTIAPKPGERWLLITSAIHMPRAMGAFRRVGFPVEPWPVMDRTHSAWKTVKHEWLGLIGYWLMDRSDQLIPEGKVTRSPRPAQPPPGM
jgi:uncharacterized SAM-binding protein YcdF (DUF218 family)